VCPHSREQDWGKTEQGDSRISRILEGRLLKTDTEKFHLDSMAIIGCHMESEKHCLHLGETMSLTKGKKREKDI
jgi:hypothetical protein